VEWWRGRDQDQEPRSNRQLSARPAHGSSRGLWVFMSFHLLSKKKMLVDDILCSGRLFFVDSESCCLREYDLLQVSLSLLLTLFSSSLYNTSGTIRALPRLLLVKAGALIAGVI